MKHVDIYSDGACSGNPGPGGYGTIVVYKKYEKVISGGEAKTTNNRMELLGAICGLEALNEPCEVTVTSDSKYLVDAVRLGWAKKWRAAGWMRTKHEPALNPDLWELVLDEAERHKIEYVWVKGHAGHPENERCDTLAVESYQNGALEEDTGYKA